MSSRFERLDDFNVLEGKAEQYLEGDIGFLLEQHAERLREADIPVDDAARLDLNIIQDVSEHWDREAYAMLFGGATIVDHDIKKRLKRDQDWAERKRAEINRGGGDNTAIGELLEVMKTISVSEWFGDDFIVVRTSDYDDLSSGVDEVIIHKGTRVPLAALDSTVGGVKPYRESADVKHGVSLREDGTIQLGPLSEIPFYIIDIPGQEVVEWAFQITKRRPESERKAITAAIGHKVLDSLIEQSSEKSGITDNKGLKELYDHYGSLFRKIRSGDEKEE